MSRQEIKAWAREKIKGEFWPLLGTILVGSFLIGFTIIWPNSSYNPNEAGSQMYYSISIGWLLYFIQVGLTYYLVRFVKDEKHEFKDLFRFSSDFGRCLGACLLQAVFIFLFTLLLIIPGIMKSLGYSLVPYLLADEKYKDMKLMDILKKSEEMMNGHKADLFVFGLSFILWYLLGFVTCGLAFFYVTPYQSVATTKFLNDIKTEAEGGQVKNNKKTTKKTEVKYCPQCGKELKSDADFCSDCGAKL